MNSRSLVLMMFAASFASCGWCEDRLRDVTIALEVAPDEPCPPKETIEAKDIVEVLGGPVRSASAPAHQACCYRGTYAADGGSVEATLCVFIDIEGDGSAGYPSLCPTREQLEQSPPRQWFLPEAGHWGPFGDEVSELSAGPDLGELYPRVDKCEYQALERTSADACG